MARKLSIGINWQGKFDFKALIDRARIADQAGIHSIWVAEAWGRDAFTLLTLLAEHTVNAQLATSIVNTYSRTPAALAQHFGTLDELSGGRMIAGIGTSGPNVIEHFHGVKFNPPLTRMREYVDIFNMLMAGAPLNYNGKIFKLGRGFTLRFDPVRKHIPIFIASLNRKSVEYTAQAADGWMPVMIPLSGLKRSIDEFRGMVSAAARDPLESRGKGARMGSCHRLTSPAERPATPVRSPSTPRGWVPSMPNSLLDSAMAMRSSVSTRLGLRAAPKPVPRRSRPGCSTTWLTSGTSMVRSIG